MTTERTLQLIWEWYLSYERECSGVPHLNRLPEAEPAQAWYHVAMSEDQSARQQLKQLRDQLAVEAPRARTFSAAPVELTKRLQAVAELVSKVYLLSAPGPGARPPNLDDLCADALVEGHLALHDWQEWMDQRRDKPRPGTPVTAERRTAERQPTGLTVRLLRHNVRGEGPALALSTETANRPARDVSLGGMFVTATKADLPEVAAGCVLHVEVSAGGSAVSARGTVSRRDDTGIALRWIVETAADQRAIQSLLAAIRR